MSEPMKKYPTKAAQKPVLCVSEEGQVYELPRNVIEQYHVHNKRISTSFQKIDALSITPESIFAEINAKYTHSGALIKAVRLREGLSQKDFAKLIEVTQGDLSKMERGKRSIGRVIASRISKKFGSKIT